MTLTMARVKVGNRPVVEKYINISSEDKAYETIPSSCFLESEAVVVLYWINVVSEQREVTFDKTIHYITLPTIRYMGHQSGGEHLN